MEAKYGRNTIVDEYSKLLVVVRQAQNASNLGYVMEALYAEIERSDNRDVQSKAQLEHKCGPVAKWLFIAKYIGYLMEKKKQDYPERRRGAEGVLEVRQRAHFALAVARRIWAKG